MSREYTHWTMFRRVWQFIDGDGWRAEAEKHYGLEAGTIEVINTALDLQVVRNLKDDLLDDLAAHRARLLEQLAQTDAMTSEVASRMSDAICATASRSIAFEPHQTVAREILLEGEFV